MAHEDQMAILMANRSIDVSDAEQLSLALNYLQKGLARCRSDLNVIQTNSDQLFLTVNAVFILMMQAGFGFFEAGCVQGKNVVNMLFKNVMDAFFGGISYWAVGYAFAFGEPCNAFIGLQHFFGRGLSSTLYSNWFFHFSFCVTAATIVSGAVAERCEFRGYVVYSGIITGITYPVITHWAWHSGNVCVGWLNKLGYQDFAGSGVVHVTGGVCALIGAVVLGPRIGRFPRFEGDKGVLNLQPHSLPFASLGAFLLFVGFFAFNGGSQASISTKLDGEQTGRAMMNTILAGSPAAIVSAMLGRFSTPEKKFDLLVTLGGGLAGMVAICAGCNAVDPWAAIVIGFVAGIVSFYSSKLVAACKIDDPVDAIAVHLGAGLWGVVSTPLFDREDGVFIKGDETAFYGLLYNLAGVLAIIIWCVVTILPTFLILKKAGWLRVSPEDEFLGLDVRKHGHEGYPEAHCKKCRAKMESQTFQELFRTTIQTDQDEVFPLRGAANENGISKSNGPKTTVLPALPPNVPRRTNSRGQTPNAHSVYPAQCIRKGNEFI